MQKAFEEIAEFWFDLGVDGLRLDVVHTINADSIYRDNEANLNFKIGNLPQKQQPFFCQLHDSAQLNQPAIQSFSESYQKIADRYSARFLMGELHGDDPIKASKTFTSAGLLHATYNFNLLEWGGFTLDGLREAINDAVEAFNGTGRRSFGFSNHDVPRSVARQSEALGIEPENIEALQLLLLKLEVCLIGSTCVYQGEELALIEGKDIPLDKMQDPWGKEFAPAFLGRVTCRTPMVRDSRAPNFGFSTANHTWLPAASEHAIRAGLEEA